MNDFNRLAGQFATIGELTDDEMRRLHAAATFADADDGLAESLGISGGSEIFVARIIAEIRQHRRDIGKMARAILDGTGRPSNVDDFLWKLSREFGNPRAEIVEKVKGKDVVEVVTSWHVLADRLEKRLRPPKEAACGGELHGVHA